MLDFRNDLSLGYQPMREQCLAEPLPIENFAENLLVTVQDASSGIGMWLHLGTYADDFTLWEEMSLIGLPDDGGLLWATSVGRPAVDDRPAGPALAFKCVEPYKRWRTTFDGVGILTPFEQTRTGIVKDGRKRRFTFDIDLEMVGPVWDAQHSATSAFGKGKMTEQSWASDHYQQLYRARGQLVLEGKTYDINGTGVRDHSRGARGGDKLKQFGGHALIGVLYENDDAWGLQRILKPDGSVAMDTGYIIRDGIFYDAEILEIPTLSEEFHTSAETMVARLRSPLGDHIMHGELMTTALQTSWLPGTAFGIDPAVEGPLVLSMGTVAWDWEGRTAWGLTERSRRGRFESRVIGG